MYSRDSTQENMPPSKVAFRKPRPGEMPYYEVPDNQLCHGASLSNRRIWVSTRADGAVERVFCNAVGLNLLGSIVVTYALPIKAVIGSFPEARCLECAPASHALLGQEGTGTMAIYPFKQRHAFDLSGELHVEETVLVPKMAEADPPAVMEHIEVTNMSTRDVSLMVTLYADLKGDLVGDLMVEFDEELGALIARNESQPNLVRLLASDRRAVAYRLTDDVSEAYGGVQAKRLADGFRASPGFIGQMQIELPIAAGDRAEASVVAIASHLGLDDAKKWLGMCRDFDTHARATVEFLTPVAGRSNVETPDTIINEGVFWAKVNMLRVMADYPEAATFTNEPGKSTNVVGRDAAWFVYGCDFLEPGFSKEQLLKLAEKQYRNGKIPEYYSALDGRTEDYGLTMNDDTPLFLLACCHHYAATRDEAFLKEIHPHAKLAAEYILSQRDDKGLVIAKADGYEVWGIASWRNVIPNYQINGAVTEINSECYAGLKEMSCLSRASRQEEDADRFDRAAEDLRTAINQHLLNKENGLYYLNIDSEGKVHTDITADEVFPVLFGVAPADVAYRIISRLRATDFMTSAGLRTLSRNSPDYEPDKLVGLKGGVWPGVAFWYAFAAAGTNPEFMVESLHAGYLQYLLDPLKNNTVPGQFSEWFDGESLVNRGMRLSPWEPPRLLWAAIEGLCGVKLGPEGYTIAPRKPLDWKWLALRRMPCDDGFLTFFATFEDSEVHVYADRPVKTEHELHVAGEDVTYKIGIRDYRVHRAAFTDGRQLTICLGCEEGANVTTPLSISGLLEPSGKYRVQIYGRAIGWLDIGTCPGADVSELAISIEDGEFRIITMTLAD